jgi:predicted transglutaminase-like cysteine proteinase
MFKYNLKVLLLIGATLLCSISSATAVQQANTNEIVSPPFEPVVKASTMPYGWALFCKQEPAECQVPERSADTIALDQDLWRELVTINTLVNSNIDGVTDNDHYGIYKMGILNWWTYPDDGRGNCNDYVMLKRKLLIEAGWPKAALMLTVVLDHEHEGHLVLTVKTNSGDLILDNMNAMILRWNETGYTFIKRQSATNPNTWLSIDPRYAVTLSSSIN